MVRTHTIQASSRCDERRGDVIWFFPTTACLLGMPYVSGFIDIELRRRSDQPANRILGCARADPAKPRASSPYYEAVTSRACSSISRLPIASLGAAMPNHREQRAVSTRTSRAAPLLLGFAGLGPLLGGLFEWTQTWPSPSVEPKLPHKCDEGLIDLTRGSFEIRARVLGNST